MSKEIMQKWASLSQQLLAVIRHCENLLRAVASTGDEVQTVPEKVCAAAADMQLLCESVLSQLPQEDRDNLLFARLLQLEQAADLSGSSRDARAAHARMLIELGGYEMLVPHLMNAAGYTIEEISSVLDMSRRSAASRIDQAQHRIAAADSPKVPQTPVEPDFAWMPPTNPPPPDDLPELLAWLATRHECSTEDMRRRALESLDAYDPLRITAAGLLTNMTMVTVARALDVSVTTIGRRVSVIREAWLKRFVD